MARNILGVKMAGMALRRRGGNDIVTRSAVEARVLRGMTARGCLLRI